MERGLRPAHLGGGVAAENRVRVVALYFREFKDWGEYVKLANIDPQG